MTKALVFPRARCGAVLTALLLTMATGLVGRLPAQAVSSKVAALPADAKLAGTGVVYSKSFFQERYMQVGKSIAYGMFIGGLYQQAVWRATGKYEGKAPVRQDANAFEALLGDFDVTGYTNERLRAKIREARHFELEFTDDAATAEALVGIASSTEKPSEDAARTTASLGRDVMAAFKVSYGLGARAGREQFGFKKTYRPFVRILGLVRRNGTGEDLWHGAVIAWGAKGYKGPQTGAKNIPCEELVDAFKAVAEDVVTLLIRSLNAEPLPPMGELVDETKDDARF